MILENLNAQLLYAERAPLLFSIFTRPIVQTLSAQCRAADLNA